MILKREHISFINFSKVFKGLLFFLVLLLTNSLSAQVVSITSLDSDAAEVTSGAQNLANFTISRPIGSLFPTVVEYTVTGSATNGVDYTVATGTINLTALVNSITIPITAVDDDSIVEGDETVIVTLTTVSAPSTINPLADEVTINIADNDVGLVSLDTVSANYIASVNEDGTLQLPAEFGQFRPVIDKANGTSAPLTVNYQITGSADNGVDYNLTNAVVLTFTNNGASLARNIRVAPIEDLDAESNETVTITLLSTNSPLYTIGAPATATITIVDNDCAAGTSAPTLNSNPTTLCDVTSVNLNTFVSGAAPAGSALRWSTVANPTQAQLLTGTAVTAATDGTYFGLYAAGTGVTFCTSPSTQLDITLNTSPTAGANSNSTACNNATNVFGATLIDLDNLLSALVSPGSWAFTSGPETANPNAANRVQFSGRPAGTYVYTYTTSGAVAPCANVSSTHTIVVADCDPCVAGTTAPPLNAATATDRCDVASVNLNTFITGGAASAPTGTTLQWSAIPNPTASGDLVPTTATASGTYYGVYWDAINTCASPSTQVDLVLSQSPTAGANANGAACNNDTAEFGPTSLDLDDLLSAGVDPGTWAFTSGPETANPNGNNVVQFSDRDDGTYVYTYTTNNAVAPCTNDSAIFTITVDDCDPCVAGNTAPVLDPGTPTIACDVFTASFNDYTNSVPPPGTVLTWSTDSDAENTNAHLTTTQANNPPTLGGTYYGFFYDAVNTCASPTLQVDIVLNVTPTLSNVTGNERCGTGSVILGAMASDNATINWYASETGGGIIGTGSSFTTPSISTSTSYYAEATLNGCPSERQQVIATIAQQPSSGIPQNNGNASACSVLENGPTILDLDDLISGEDVGAWVYTSGPFANFDIPSNNILNFEGRPDGEYVFTYTTSGAMAPCLNESTVMTITVNDCDVDTDLDGLFDGIEATLGTDPNNSDTDGDGINDGEEVGPDLDNPLDSDVDSDGVADPDGTIDALDSNILDEDNDGIVDQLDPGNDNPCVPTRLNGVCDFDLDDVPDVDDPEPDNPCVPDINHPNCNPEPVDLEITKEVDNINALLGEEVTFTVTLRNLDPNVKSRNIKVGDLLESGFQYISHDTSVGTYDLQTGEWDIFEVDPLSTHTLTVKAEIIEGGTYSNTAELLDSFPEDINAANDRATVTLPIELPEGVNLILEKTVSLGVGKEKLKEVTGLVSGVESEVEVIYYLKVINKSQQDIVSNIRVNDIFLNDDAVEFEVMDAEVPSETTFDEASGVWIINRSLAIEEEIELSFRVSFRSEGVVTNTAVIESSLPRESTIEDADSTSSAKVEITTRNEVEVGILYNQFSPNNDGLNDFLKVNRIKKNEVGDDELVEIVYNIQIFNRYGNLVFEAANKKEDEVWDGSWKGKDAPDGTYFYTMNLDFGEGPKTQKGWIQLIR